MRDTLRISDVRFVAASAALRATGLLGWATVSLNGEVELGYIAVRRTRAGEIALSFPERSDPSGARHSIVKPLRQSSRDAITAQVLDALSAMGVRL